MSENKVVAAVVLLGLVTLIVISIGSVLNEAELLEKIEEMTTASDGSIPGSILNGTHVVARATNTAPVVIEVAPKSGDSKVLEFVFDLKDPRVKKDVEIGAAAWGGTWPVKFTPPVKFTATMTYADPPLNSTRTFKIDGNANERKSTGGYDPAYLTGAEPLFHTVTVDAYRMDLFIRYRGYCDSIRICIP